MGNGSIIARPRRVPGASLPDWAAHGARGHGAPAARPTTDPAGDPHGLRDAVRVLGVQAARLTARPGLQGLPEADDVPDAERDVLMWLMRAVNHVAQFHPCGVCAARRLHAAMRTLGWAR